MLAPPPQAGDSTAATFWAMGEPTIIRTSHDGVQWLHVRDEHGDELGWMSLQPPALHPVDRVAAPDLRRALEQWFGAELGSVGVVESSLPEPRCSIADAGSPTPLRW